MRHATDLDQLRPAAIMFRAPSLSEPLTTATALYC